MTLLTRGEVANCPGSPGTKGQKGHGAKMKQVSGRPGWAGHTDYRTRHWDSRKRGQWVFYPCGCSTPCVCFPPALCHKSMLSMSSDGDTDPVDVDGKHHWGKMGLQPSDPYAFSTSTSGFLNLTFDLSHDRKQLFPHINCIVFISIFLTVL